MRYVVALIAGILLLSGCHPTANVEPVKAGPNETSSDQMAADSMTVDSFYSYSSATEMIYPDVEPMDEIELTDRQDDANYPNRTPPDMNDPNASQPTIDEPQADPNGAVYIIMTASMTFEPADVSVNLGQTVIWTNNSEWVHTVTANPAMAQNKDDVSVPVGAQPFDSGDIAPGKTYTMTFSVPGTYKYFCKPHELAGMLGQITVMPAAAR